MEQAEAVVTKRRQLATSSAAIRAAIAIIGFLVLAVAVVLIVLGKIEQDGSYMRDGYVYDVRTPGIILAGVTLLVAPVAWLVAYFVEVWAED